MRPPRACQALDMSSNGPPPAQAAYPFTPKHTMAVKLHLMSGVCASTRVRLPPDTCTPAVHTFHSMHKAGKASSHRSRTWQSTHATGKSMHLVAQLSHHATRGACRCVPGRMAAANVDLLEGR